MKVAFAANRKVKLAEIGNHLVRELATLPVEASIALRAPKSGPPQHFEELTATLAQSIGIEVEWYQPETGGREGVFDRDWRMVRSATRLIAYIADETPQDAGTHHLIECAMVEEIEAVVYYSDGNREHVLAWLGGT